MLESDVHHDDEPTSLAFQEELTTTLTVLSWKVITYAALSRKQLLG
jgi:hypothetical protein